MALMSCLACGSQVSRQAYACPKCGHPTPAAQAHYERLQPNRWWFVGVALVLLILAIERVSPELLTKIFGGLGL